MFAGRQARYGTLAATSVLAVLGILVAINYIGSRQNKRWDLTVNKQFSLSDQSRNVTSKLDAPLQILVFAQEPEFQRHQDKLKEYEYASKRVSAEYIDPDKKPAIAKQNQVQAYGTIVFNYKGRTERGRRQRAGHHQRHHQGRDRSAEEGLLHVRHGEKDTTSSERDGLQRHRDGAHGRELQCRQDRAAQTGLCLTMRR